MSALAGNVRLLMVARTLLEDTAMKVLYIQSTRIQVLIVCGPHESSDSWGKRVREAVYVIGTLVVTIGTAWL